MTCVVLGFATAGLFLKSAFQDWEDEPIITTVDSIAAPISKIQFPTVTICQDEYKRPDNWAFLETILNYVAFECRDDVLDNFPDDEPCDKTVKIRKDFHDLIQTVADKFKGWIMNPKLETTAVYDVLDNKLNINLDYNNPIIVGLKCQIVNLMETRKIQKNKIFKLMSSDHFARLGSIQSILITLSDELDYSDDGFNYLDAIVFRDKRCSLLCNSTNCKKNEKLVDKAVRFLLVMMNVESKQPFGSFLASFAYLSHNFLGFKPRSNVDIPTIENKEKFPDCKKIDPKNYHEYFEKLSKIVGFSEKELLSLYDLPAIVANLNISNLEAPSFPNFFLYSRCRKISNWTSQEKKFSTLFCSGQLKFWKAPLEENFSGKFV